MKMYCLFFLLFLISCDKKEISQEKSASQIITDEELVGIWRMVVEKDTTYMVFDSAGTGYELDSDFEKTELTYSWIQRDNQLRLSHQSGQGMPRIISYQNDSLKLGNGMNPFVNLVKVDINVDSAIFQRSLKRDLE